MEISIWQHMALLTYKHMALFTYAIVISLPVRVRDLPIFDKMCDTS